MKKIIFLLFAVVLSTSVLAQIPSYCSSLEFRLNPPGLPSARVFPALTSVGLPTASCPNGYPVWEGNLPDYGGRLTAATVYRDPTNCNKWFIRQYYLDNNEQVRLYEHTTAIPTDNPPPVYFVQVAGVFAPTDVMPDCKTPTTNPCLAVQTIITTITTSPEVVQASNKVIATNVVNSGSNLLYRAGNSVTLSPGFNAKSGATFTAVISGCR